MAYVDGFVASVPAANKAAYTAMTKTMAALFLECGALQVVDSWGDDVPEGKLTSFPMAVQRKPDEVVCFGWIVWPSRAARDAGFKKAMADPRMAPGSDMPFDGNRMIFGGFAMIQRDGKDI